MDHVNFNRDHDVRITLNKYEIVKPEHLLYSSIHRLIRSLAQPNPGESTIHLTPRTKDWNVRFIRHKQKETYAIEDKFIVAISNIRECYIPPVEEYEQLEVKPSLYKPAHTEIEVTNCYL